MHELIRRLWVRLTLRNIHYNDNAAKLNRLYRAENPWEMQSEREQSRFLQTNQLIKQNFGRVGTLMEVGCGEGHQSEHLKLVCEKLYGLDVSERAIARASARCRDSLFAVGDIFEPRLFKQVAIFDLVVACEVLYYMADIPAALEKLSTLGRACLVTYYATHAGRLDPLLAAIPNKSCATISHDKTVWSAVWWRNDGKQPRQAG